MSRFRAAVLVAILGIALLAVSPARADESAADPAAPTAEVAGDGPTLTLAELGYESSLALYGTQGSETLTVPVPRGLAPTSLNLGAQLPVFVAAAVITVTQDDRVVGRVEVPAAPERIVVPLSGVQVSERTAYLTVHSYLRPVDGYCLDPTNPLRLTEVSVGYSGTEVPPSTVADFLPVVLGTLTLYLPAEPSQAESDTAVRIAAAVAAHYGAQNPRINLVALAGDSFTPPRPAGPQERQIVVREGPDQGLSLRGPGPIPALLISGPAAELGNQSRLLFSDIGRVALSSSAVVGPLRPVPVLPMTEASLRELGLPGGNARALAPQVSIGLDQTRLGQPVRDIRVHLRGSHTPLPEAISGQLVARIGDVTVDRWSTGPDGVIDRWVSVPDDLLQRYTTLTVAVDISGNTGGCGEFQPLTLTIDDDSVVRSQAAEPPVPAGLQSVPQALMPTVRIGIGADTFADTRRAVQIITGLQPAQRAADRHRGGAAGRCDRLQAARGAHRGRRLGSGRHRSERYRPAGPRGRRPGADCGCR